MAGESAARPAPLTIPRHASGPAGDDPSGFWSLRDTMIAHLQDATGVVWTDYNLHDPGLTLVEALCFMLTDILYRADLPVADLLRRADGTIDWQRQGLFLPADILPARPATAEDLRHWLIGCIPALADVRLSVAPDRPGLHRINIIARPDDDIAGIRDQLPRQVLAAYRCRRGLGEDADDMVEVVRTSKVRLAASVEISGKREASEIAANILAVAQSALATGGSLNMIPDPATAASRRVALPLDVDSAASGPAPDADPDDGEAGPLISAATLAALRRAVAAVDGVDRLASLSLQAAASHDRTTLLFPELCLPGEQGTAQDLALIRAVELHRDGKSITLDAGDVAFRLFAIRPTTARTAMAHATGDESGDRSGDHSGDPMVPPAAAATARWSPIGDLLPHVYGLAAQGAERTPPQLQAYLAIFDQFLADCAARLHQAGGLFSVDTLDGHGHLAPVVVPDVLGSENIPGLDLLYRDDERRRLADVLVGDDEPLDRRHAALDHLLSLYGETYPTAVTAAYLDTIDSRAASLATLHLKTLFLTHLPHISRGRTAGIPIDDAAAWWVEAPAQDRSAKTSGFQLRLALLSGFAEPCDRRLAVAAAAWPNGGAASRSAPPEAEALTGLPPGPALSESEMMAALASGDTPRERLFRLGSDRRNYRWHDRQLLLIDADRGATIVARDGSRHAAARLVQALAPRLARVASASEGFHIVEHVLLRERSPGLQGRSPWRLPLPGLADLALTVSIIAPAWTARTSRRSFRRHVEQLARESAPAHVMLRHHWLDVDSMAGFEQDLAVWRRALHGWQHGMIPADRLDAAAASLWQWLVWPIQDRAGNG
ncbi:MAG: hypothetical protein RL490_1978 [Pseudomonadota bacterium]